MKKERVSEDMILLWGLGIAAVAALVMDLGFDKGWW